MFIGVIKVLAFSEPNTSYRNPISLEKILLDICITLWNSAAAESEETLLKIDSRLPLVEVHGNSLESPEDGVEKVPATKKPAAKRAPGRGAAKPKKGREPATGDAAPPRAKPRKKKGAAENTVG
jgi:hypothetical protein